MSFDYEKLKQREAGSDNSWSSNSDLFMVLSLVFLLLYVVSSLRNGSSSVQRSIQYKELQSRNEDLEQQILAYEALKDDYLQKQASKDEMQMYGELMNKLSLLQDEAKEEKNDLRKKALENEKKENALNKYQQIIRNIVNTNLLAQKRINRRDNKIKDQSIQLEENTITINKNTKTISEQKVNIKNQQKTIKNKLKIIAKSKQTIRVKRKQAKALKMIIYKNKQTIKNNNKKIVTIDKALANNINKLNQEFKKHKYSKKKLNIKISALKKREIKRVNKLKNQNKKVQAKLNSVGNNLRIATNKIENAKKVMKKQDYEQKLLSKKLRFKRAEISRTKKIHTAEILKLKKAHSTKINKEKKIFNISLNKQRLSNKEKTKKLKDFKIKMAREEKSLQNKISNLSGLVEKTSTSLKQKKAQLQRQNKEISDLRIAHNKKMLLEKSKFNKNLNKQRLSNALKSKKHKEFKEKMNNEERKMNSKIASLKQGINHSTQKLNKVKNKLKKSEKGRKRSIASVTALKNKNSKLSSELIKAKSLIDTRKKLAQKIYNNLRRAGIKAEVNKKTGDVTISFGKEYFESGSAHLKTGMLASLKKFIPIYSASVFNDPKVAKKVAAVEVIGFASPTYMGKFVNPKSLKTSDQKAVRYNLKLSQRRANSVFNYIFDKDKLKYQYQKKLYPLVKVTGRSFIANEISNSKQYEGMSNASFCSVYNCKKAQRVIIKFSLKN